MTQANEKTSNKGDFEKYLPRLQTCEAVSRKHRRRDQPAEGDATVRRSVEPGAEEGEAGPCARLRPARRSGAGASSPELVTV